MFNGEVIPVTEQVASLSTTQQDVIQEVLDFRDVKSRYGTLYPQFLIKWLGKPATESTWVAGDELKQIILKYMLFMHQTLISFQEGENDVGTNSCFIFMLFVSSLMCFVFEVFLSRHMTSMWLFNEV